MKHLNGSMLCAIDTETTGLEAGYHEIVQLAIIPMDAQLLPRKDIMPLNIIIRPEYPERWTHKVMHEDRKAEILSNGLDSEKAKDVLEDWFIRLAIPPKKTGTPNNITALGQNYAFDQAMLKAWLGIENYSRYIHYHFRDTMVAALFLNDLAAYKCEPAPYPMVGLKDLASTLLIKNDYPHNAYYDALTTAQVYRRLMGATS